jgi:hypothetical protein
MNDSSSVILATPLGRQYQIHSHPVFARYLENLKVEKTRERAKKLYANSPTLLILSPAAGAAVLAVPVI